MGTATSGAGQARHVAGRATQSRTLDRLARIGMVSRAVLYALIGVLALRIAFGSGGEEADKSGAVHSIASQPWGAALLWVMVVGFAAMAVWQFAVAAAGRGEVVDRVEAGLRCGVYLVILATILSVLLSGSSESGDQQARDLTGWLLDLPGGRIIVSAIGVGVVVLGLYWAYQAVSKRFLEDMHLGSMSPRGRWLTERLGLAGYLARGAIAVLAGGFLVVAAVQYDPERAKGIDATLRTIADSPGGPWLLSAVAVGLLLFAGYCLCEARWRRV